MPSDTSSGRAPQRTGEQHLACILALLLAAGIAAGQAKSGNIYGVVLAEDGSALQGVTVTLKGAGTPQNFVTDRRGEFHFLNLDPADDYALRLDLTGFAVVERRGVAVAVGVNTSIRVAMKQAAVEASVTVVGDAPLLDPRRVGTGATIERREMDTIPSARDPWAAVQTVPGVLVDKVNVGGNYSGQASGFIAKGSQTSQGSWNLDGATISDMAVAASSPTYWDFDSFQEIQAVTGGSDPSIATSGVTLNLVTRRGTNRTRGSARVFVTDSAFQAKPTLSEEEKRQQEAGGGATPFVGNQITGIQDYGIEIGGPVLKDRLWLWGSYGRQQIDLLAVTGQPDKTTIEDINAKATFQAIESNGLTVFYLRGDKRKSGRGASPTRPPETTQLQSGPTSLYKMEDSQVFSSKVVVEAFWSFLDENFRTVAAGGPAPQAFLDADSVWHNSYRSNYVGRPQHQVSGSVNYFLSTGALGHELKAGGGVRRVEARSETVWPGQGIIAYAQGSGTCSGGDPPALIACGAITRNASTRDKDDYVNFFFSDTITQARLTATLGVRYDDQKGSIQSSSVPANALYPTILPAASAPAIDGVVHWKDWSPRAGLTYAIGDARETLARASYARYANQLTSNPTFQLSAISGVAFAYYPWKDRNSNNLIDPGELDTSGKAIRTSSFDPANPSSPVSVNSIDPNLTSQKTDEFLVGLEHELMPSFAVGAAYTYRHYSNFYFAYPSFGGAIPRYVFDHINNGTLPDGTRFSTPVYSISGAVPPGLFYTNRPDYSQTFNGVEVTFNKRFSDGWMARGSFAYNNSRQHVGTRACVDPNNTAYKSGEDFVPGACEDGGIVAPSGGVAYLNSTWQFHLNGAWQAPLGLTVAGNLYGRQGFPIAYFVQDTRSADRQLRNLYVTAVDAYRYGSVFELDLGLRKEIPISSSVSAALSADVFNVLNRNTVLMRNAMLGKPSPATGTNTVSEMQSPRIVRFGGRISF